MTTLSIFAHDTNSRDVIDGEVIFNDGDAGDKMYVLIDGTIELSVHNRLLVRLGPGEMFGEMALLDAGPRTATATARGNAKIVPVDQRRFLYLVQNTPFFAIEVMRSMSMRLRSMDELL